tara:strand:+ start:1158 stop:1337 length:180 start_codon:yes stop_codon:yes gene_type:complete
MIELIIDLVNEQRDSQGQISATELKTQIRNLLDAKFEEEKDNIREFLISEDFEGLAGRI